MSLGITRSQERRSVREDDRCQASSVSSEVPGVARCPTAILASLSSWRTSQMRSAAQHDADNICRRPHAGSRQDSAMLNVGSMSMLPRCSLAKECVQPPCGAQKWRQSALSGKSATLNRPPSRGLSRARALVAGQQQGGVMIRTLKDSWYPGRVGPGCEHELMYSNAGTRVNTSATLVTDGVACV